MRLALRRRVLVLRACLLLPLAIGAPLHAESVDVAWRRALELPGLGGAAAVAFDAARERLAVGDAAGVWMLAPGRPAARVLHRGPVQDLLFAPEGTLLAATARGLFRIGPDGQVREAQLGPGSGGVVRRLAHAGDTWLAAGDDGAHLSRDGVSWQRLDAGLVSGPAQAIAARADAHGVEVWLIARGTPQRIRVVADRAVGEPMAGELRDLAARRGALDVAADLPGAEVAVLGSDRLFLRSGGRWQWQQPPLPPGAVPLRLGHGAGRVWIATDRGLVEAPTLAGPWRRASPPAGSFEALAVAGAAHAAFAAGPRGLLRGEPLAAAPAGVAPEAAAAPASEPASVSALGPDPPIDEVRRVALRYLELGPARMRRLREGVDRRAWLPEVELGAGYAEDRARSFDHDEVLSGGSLWQLHDDGRDRGHGWDAAVSLSWDLGGVLYHPEALDVSREAREIIELRDDVLDEITQLYFERQRARVERAALAPDSHAERARLALRAAELAAGIDAWTDGWFGRAAGIDPAQASPPAPGLETRP